MMLTTAKSIAVISIALIACIGITAIFLYSFVSNSSVDALHFDRDEMKLTVVNLTGSTTVLFRAGTELDSASVVDDYDAGGPTWLSRGDYFLAAELNGMTTYYPVNIAGFDSGPERDASLAITLRQPPLSAPPLPNGSPGLRSVPPGYFLMGDRLNPNEPHYVWLQGYFIGEFEVTNAEYRQFVRSVDGFENDGNWTGTGIKWKHRERSSATALLTANDPEYGRFGADDMPVTGVTWYEAVAYCRWLTSKYGGGTWIYSLPTEAEWEKAGRGPDGFDYPLGRFLSDDQTALYNWKKNPLTDKTVIGVEESRKTYKPNRWGLYHMGGNVVEWTRSLYRPLSRQSPYQDDERNSTETSGSRVARGGSWYSASAALLYIAYRDAFEPEISHHDLGFRIVAQRIPAPE